MEIQVETSSASSESSESSEEEDELQSSYDSGLGRVMQSQLVDANEESSSSSSEGSDDSFEGPKLKHSCVNPSVAVSLNQPRFVVI